MDRRVKYYADFTFCDTKEQAENIITSYNKRASRYQRAKFPGHFTDWTSGDGSEHKIIVWTSR